MTAALKLLRPRGRRTAPIADPRPEPPAHLDPVARTKWVEIVGTLQARAHDQGVMDMLTLYADGVGTVAIRRGRGRQDRGRCPQPPELPPVNPWLSVARQARDRLVRLSKRLGIATPR